MFSPGIDGDDDDDDDNARLEEDDAVEFGFGLI